jgi:hypothetical protein
VLDGAVKDHAGAIEVVAGVQHALDTPCLGPLLDLVVIAVVGEQRIVGFFVGPIIHAVLLLPRSLPVEFIGKICSPLNRLSI